MTYRFKPTEVEAIRIPKGITVEVKRDGFIEGSQVGEGEWLVAVDEKLVAFTEGEFEAQFEPVNGRALPRAVRKPKLARKPKTSPRPARSGPEARPAQTILELIVEALSEKARTVGQLVQFSKARDRILSRASVSTTLTILKKQGRVENNDIGEWRLL